MSCEHRHHGHPEQSATGRPAALLALLVVPFGLLICQQCGVHFCSDELAVTLELWRIMVNTVSLSRRYVVSSEVDHDETS